MKMVFPELVVEKFAEHPEALTKHQRHEHCC